MLDVQINIYSVDTGNFYSNREAHLHWLNHKLRTERNKLIKKAEEDSNELKKYGITDMDLSLMLSDEYDFSNWEDNETAIRTLAKSYCKCKKWISDKNKKIKKSKDALLLILENKINENIKSNGKHHIRELNENKISDTNIISVFDSSLTRMIGAKQDELTEDFMVVQVYYFDVIKDLINFGFMYKGEKYIYFTSSAGQIRTKKCVFIKESVWNKYEKTIMCGLTVDSINAKGGCNPNKYLAYLALTNSATDVWNEFDIDKAIVIDDFETQVYGTYDLIDDKDYSIKRISDYVPIPHTDGAGMMLPVMGKNRMVRLPWIKGLLGVFDFVKFIEVNNCSPIIKDIYGKEHDVIAEGIQVIFTKSQFKMWKYYDSWEQYKEFYKQYGCSAGQTNIEEDRIKNTTINYQMLQTFTDISDKEIEMLVEESNTILQCLCDSVENVQKTFGISPYNTDKTFFQKSVELYPNLLNDEFVKSKIREIKNSLVKKFKSGKLRVKGKYTFLLPDFYAACEYWFGEIKNPKGLLDDGEVFCWLFRKSEKLDCLRSPHLYREHAIRKNLAYRDNKKQKELREWYTTDAIYTSTHDLISKVLQFDVDGDKSLVVADETFITIAERNMKGIVPLYYNMRKANPVILTNQTIYDGLNAAFIGGNIGIYSNDISKIWNSETFISGSKTEKEEAINIIKILCMENNFVIDYAKTLYKPERPKEIHEKIKEFVKENVPHFFLYAKDKESYQVSERNDSFVNKLEGLIINPRVNMRSLKLGKIDYTLLMNNPDIDCKVSFLNNGRLDEKNTNPLIVKYLELSKNCYIGINLPNNKYNNNWLSSEARQYIKFNKIVKKVKAELSQFGYNQCEITDILVKFLYGVKSNKHKILLWNCYGDTIYQNLSKHIKPKTKSVQCIDCGEWFDILISDNRTCRCEDCKREHIQNLRKMQNQRAYEKRKH